MKNKNIYELSDDLEKLLKNGKIPYLILFSEISSSINKFIENEFEHKRIIEPTQEFPYLQKTIKIHHPFSIGQFVTKIIYFDNIFSKDDIWKMDENKFRKQIKEVCKKYKNVIIGLPFIGPMSEFRNKIYNSLEPIVHETKVAIIN